LDSPHARIDLSPDHPSVEIRACPPAELAIIVPTYCEAQNVGALIERIDASLAGVSWELIFVDDDSPDRTAELVRDAARRDARIRLVHRIGRRGLSSAVIEGMQAATAPYLAVIDGDLQHDETLLGQMLEILQRDGADLVVGSRYADGGGLGALNRNRRLMSRFAGVLGRRLIGAAVADPMSGFFMIKASVFRGCVRRLSGVGYKILLDILAEADAPLRVIELPYRFGARRAGSSKLDNAVLAEYAFMLIQKVIGKAIPIRFIAFSLIGVVGIAVHLSVLGLLHRALGLAFLTGQVAATLVAMTGNFILNNLLTYRDMRLKGRQLVWGWFSFVLACSIGGIANVGIATYLNEPRFEIELRWIPAALAGILVGAVWNYAVTAVYTWKRRA
jgi:dolichol-phosphate mannosyltransferase